MSATTVPRPADRPPIALTRPHVDPRWVWAIGLPLLVAALAFAASQGAYALTTEDLGRLWLLWQQPTGSPHEPSLAGAQVFWHIRAPRLAMAVLAGAALGLGGALVQGLFRNPLADPGLIGVSAGGALGAATCIVVLPLAGWALPGFGQRGGGAWATMMAAFTGALFVTALAWRLARRQGRIQVAQLLLVGVAINALAGAGLGLLTYLANDIQLRALTFWLMGSLAPSQWPAVLAVCPWVAAAVLLSPALTRSLDALALGEAQAHLMGVRIGRVQRASVVLTALAVGSVTAVIGMVGFIGLVAPHIVRQLFGPRHRAVLPGSALFGATLVVLADTAARTLFAPAELPLGVLTGLIGAPAFLWILQRRPAASTT